MNNYEAKQLCAWVNQHDLGDSPAEIVYTDDKGYAVQITSISVNIETGIVSVVKDVVYSFHAARLLLGY
jgi:hypothetical protein